MKTQKSLYTLLAGLLIVLSIIGIACSPTPAVVQQPTPVAVQQQQPQVQPQAAFDMQAQLTKYLSTLPDGFSLVAADKFKEQLDTTKPFVLDVREAKEAETDGFIAGAVNIPIRTLAQNLAKLPAKDQPIVIYCGIGHRGAMGLAALQMLGYTNVKSLKGGFTAWKAANYPIATGTISTGTAGTAPQVDAQLLGALDKYLTGLPDGFSLVAADKLKEQLASTKPFVLDVREAAELKDGYIEGAVNLPIRTLLTNLDKLPQDKTAPIVVYCGIGHRGALALVALNNLGYTNVKSLKGGYTAWTAAGFPVMKSGS